MRVDHGEVGCGGGEGVAGEGDHMIWRGGVNVALQVEPHVLRGGDRSGGIHTAIETTAWKHVQPITGSLQ